MRRVAVAADRTRRALGAAVLGPKVSRLALAVGGGVGPRRTEFVGGAGLARRAAECRVRVCGAGQTGLHGTLVGKRTRWACHARRVTGGLHAAGRTRGAGEGLGQRPEAGDAGAVGEGCGAR